MKNIWIYTVTLLFTFITTDLIGQCSLSCIDEIQVSVDENCEALITLDMVLQDQSGSCTYSLRVEELNGTPVSNPVPSDYIDQTLRVSVYSGENSCETLINIEDKLGPVVTCPSDVTVSCYEEFMEGFTSIPVENCGDYYQIVIADDDIVDLVCDVTNSAVRTVSFYAVDERGNESAICTQTIYYTRPDLINLTFPRNYDDISISTPSLKCDETDIWDLNDNFYPDPEETGAPMIDGFPIIPTENKFCEINVNFEDDTIALCGNSFKILRTWTVLDWCQPTSPGVNPVVDVQIIKIEDDRGPEVECPEPFEGYTGKDDCYASIIPPAPMVLDDCSGVGYSVSYRFSDDFGLPTGLTFTNNIEFVEVDSFYIIKRLPLGRTWIYYDVFDDCNNVTVCSTYVEIIDNDVPTAVCDEHTTISLGSDGTARAFAATFDDGSRDNCEIISYEVRRSDENACSDNLFRAYVDFCCTDAGNYIPIELRVTDKSGNQNTCKVQIRVDDKQVPILNCPDITIDCKVDYTDPEETGGYPLVHDNCDVTITFVDDYFEPNDCGAGSFYRTWKAVDNQGLEDECRQRITIQVFDPFDGSINWPEDIHIESCSINSADPAWTGYPSFISETCSFIAASYEDKSFKYYDGHCYEIWRKWKVIDWCQFDREDPYSAGSWWYTQKIFIDDSEAPTILSSCDDVEIASNASDCIEPVLLSIEASDNCTDSLAMRYEYRIDTDLNGTYEIFGQRNNEIVDLPLGINRIYWRVIDDCGNVSKCDYLITVVDGKPPTPYCLGGINTVIMPSLGEISIWASDFNLNSFDNCDSELKFSFSSDTSDYSRRYDCNSLGMDTIEVWVTDLSGNQDYCRTMVDIQSTTDVCDSIQSDETNAMIQGLVMSTTLEPIESVEISLSENNNLMSKVNSNFEGNFTFEDLTVGNDYKVTAFKNDDIKNGVSTLDLVLIQRHILGLNELDTPYKLIAADINNNQSISASDLISLRKVILNISDEFPNNYSWRFMDVGQEFHDINYPWNYSEEFLLSPADDIINTELMGVKIGDVNESVELSNGPNGSPRGKQNVSIDIDYTTISLWLENDKIISGLQMAIDYPDTDIEILSVNSDQIEINQENFNNNGAHLIVSLSSESEINIQKDKPFLKIQYRAKTKSEIHTHNFKLDNEILNSEIYTELLEIENLTLIPRSIKNDGEEAYILQNHPNPFSNGTNIEFYIPESGKVTFNALQLDGKSIYKFERHFEKGKNNIKLDANVLQTNGVFLYYIEYEGRRYTNKMIRI